MGTMGPVDEAAYSREFQSARARQTALTVIFSCDAAVIVLAQLILALRHPQNRGPSSELTIEWVRGLIGKLGENGFPVLAGACEADLEHTMQIRREHVC